MSELWTDDLVTFIKIFSDSGPSNFLRTDKVRLDGLIKKVFKLSVQKQRFCP